MARQRNNHTQITARHGAGCASMPADPTSRGACNAERLAPWLAALAVCGMASAADTTWTSTTNGAWSDPARWSAGAPDATSTAIFSNLGGPTVSMPLSGSSALRLIVRRGNITFAAGGPLELGWSSAFSPALVIGDTSGILGKLTLNGTSIQAASFDLGTVNNAQGEARMNGVSTFTIDGALRIGVAGTGSLQHTGSATLTAGSLELGTLGTGVGSLTGLVTSSSTVPPAGPVSIGGTFTIGKFGSGLARTGSVASCGTLIIGQNPTASGTLYAVNLDVLGQAVIGMQGQGSVVLTGTMSTSGPVTVAERGPDVGSPTLPLSRGTLEVTGGSIRAGGTITLGRDGAGTTIIRSGGSIESTASITRSGANDVITVELDALPGSAFAFSAPAMTITPEATTIALQVVGTPSPDAVWRIARSWGGTMPSCTVAGSPGTGREFHLVTCGGDLLLATAPIGSGPPAVCGDVPVATFIPDEIGIIERGFSNGGIAVGEGFYAVGSPGTGGGVDVYRSINGVWYLETTLVSPDGRQVGLAVAADGQRIAARTVDGEDVVTFVRTGGVWSAEQVIDLVPAPGTQSRRSTLALDGDTLVIGEPNAVGGTTGTVLNAGRVDVLRLVNGTWTNETTLVQNPAVANGRIGRMVQLSGDRLAVGSGSAWSTIFERAGSVWTETTALPAPSTISSFAMHDDIVAFPGTTLAAWSATADGLWREALTGPATGSWIAAGAGMIALPTSARLQTFVRDGSAWRMGPSPALSRSPTGVAINGALTVVAHGDGASIMGTVPTPPCPADLTGDGSVDGADLGLLLSSWELSPVGDLNGDGITDGADLGLMLSAFGPCEP